MKISKLDGVINEIVHDAFSEFIFKCEDFNEMYSDNPDSEEIEKKIKLMSKCFKAGFLSAYLYAE